MKKIFLLSALMMGGLITAQAQIGIHIGVNIPVHRVYVPAQPVFSEEIPVSYNDDYYYLPEVEAYYSVPQRMYYYNYGGRWISAAYLPGRYRYYDWHTARRYEIRSPRPYLHHDLYRSRWGGFANGRGHSDYANHSNYRTYRGANQHFNNSNWSNQRYDQHFVNRRNENHGQSFGHSNWHGQSNHNQRFNGSQNRGQQRFTQNNLHERRSNGRSGRF